MGHLDWVYYGSDSEVKTAAMLAWEGYLTSVEHLSFIDKDITDIPRVEIEKLASIVTRNIWIDNTTPTRKLDSILAGAKCTELTLLNIVLSEENTQALVTAMRERVEDVKLDDDITLDIEQLTKYDGQGRCWELVAEAVTKTRHGDTLRRWAADVGWSVKEDFWKLMIESTSAYALQQQNKVILGKLFV